MDNTVEKQPIYPPPGVGSHYEVAKAATELEYTIIDLIKNVDKFYGNILIAIDRSFSYSIPTAGVGFEQGQIYPSLTINPAFFLSLTKKERIGLLRHECLHLVLRHISRRGDVHPKVWNVAADLSVNCFCPELDTLDGITVEKFNAQHGTKLKKFETVEYYLNNMPQDLKDKMALGALGYDFDSHEKWEELSEEQKELLKDFVLRTASKSTTDHLPEFIKAEIEKLKNAKPLDWPRLLRNYVGQALAPFKIKTRKKVSRRFGIIFQGRKKMYMATVAICIDTSGSVSDELIARFFVEIDKISDSTECVQVIECDSDVRANYPYKKGDVVSVKGRGGTRYDPAIKFAEKFKPDLIIMLGDGDAADTPQKPNCPVIWCNPQSNPSSFGKHIKLTA